MFLKISDILLTISHCRAYATATAIAVNNSSFRQLESQSGRRVGRVYSRDPPKRL